MGTLTIGLAEKRGVWFGVLVDNRDRLVASAFSKNRETLSSHLARLSRKLTNANPEAEPHTLATTMTTLFDGEESSTDIPMDNESVTRFQQKVYGVLRRIPRGRVTSYGSVATAIKSGPRAVGTAVASNPWPLFVPCHRVVPSDLTVGSYSMGGRLTEEGSETKKQLLRREGVLFQQERILPAFLWKPRPD